MKRRFQQAVFSGLDLKCRLSSGMELNVLSPTDWSLLSDIFVDGEYDLAIDRTMSQTPLTEKINIIDLGANVGFFEMRLFQRLQQNGINHERVRIYAIEPDEENIREFNRRVATTGKWHPMYDRA